MNNTRVIFDEILDVLLSKYPDRYVRKIEHGVTYLRARDSEFWMSNEFGELIVGFGLNHVHYSEEFGNLKEGIQMVFDLLHFPIKTIYHKKSTRIFKISVQIKLSETEIKEFGFSKVLLYPFWKKTSINEKISIQILNKETISNEFDEIFKAVN